MYGENFFPLATMPGCGTIFSWS